MSRSHRGVAQPGLERYVRDVEVEGSNPFAPTIFPVKPFGQQVEGFSHFRDKTYVNQRKIQTSVFEQTTFRSVLCRKPFGPKVLRKFKRLHGDVDLKMSLKKLLLLPSRHTFQMMAKAKVAVYETAVEN